MAFEARFFLYNFNVFGIFSVLQNEKIAYSYRQPYICIYAYTYIFLPVLARFSNVLCCCFSGVCLFVFGFKCARCMPECVYL